MLQGRVDQHGGIDCLRTRLRRVADRAIRLDVHVILRIRTIGKRPQHGIRIRRIDIFAHGNDDFAAIGPQGGGALQSPPHLGARRTVCELQKDDRAHVAQRLVHDHAANAFDPQLLAQMRQKHRLVGHFFDHARFAGCDLADDRNENRRAAVRDRRHLHRHVVVFQRHVAIAFAKGAFRLEQFSVDHSLDHDF